MADDTTSAPGGSTRRTVVRAVAWTAPVVTVAAAAPAFATSTNGISDPRYRKSYPRSAAHVSDITVTNDGPDPLAPNTVQLAITAYGGGLFLNDGEGTTGAWTLVWGIGTVARFLYDAVVPVGTDVPLVGTCHIRESDPLFEFDVDITYIGP